VSAGVGFTGTFAIAVFLVAFLACIVCATTATARDAGPTLPIESVLAERQPEGGHTDLVSDMAVTYPVATRGLRQAVLRSAASLPQAHAKWLTQPIAVIVDDVASRRWLTQQGDALHALGASILVLRVQSAERMRALRKQRADLPMAPAAAPELVEALRAAGAAVYPLVIFTDGSLKQDVRSLVPEHPSAGKSERDRP
jgi:integrating conjugative element protein (TIGR03765 family)